MKHRFLASASVGAILLSGSAQARDIAAKPVVMPPAFSWTGFYVGANIGSARMNSTISDDPSTPINFLGVPSDVNGSGTIGGIQAGYNYQLSNLLLGVETDLSFASREQSISGIGGSTFGTYTTRLTRLSTVRGRIGLAVDRFLVYGTGGVAFASIKNDFDDTAFPFNANSNKTLTGWTGGFGVEYAFSDHWTAKAEYLQVSVPSQSAAENSFGYAFAFKNRIDIGRVGINYKF